jgi:hypothetical protein
MFNLKNNENVSDFEIFQILNRQRVLTGYNALSKSSYAVSMLRSTYGVCVLTEPLDENLAPYKMLQYAVALQEVVIVLYCEPRSPGRRQ